MQRTKTNFPSSFGLYTRSNYRTNCSTFSHILHDAILKLFQSRNFFINVLKMTSKTKILVFRHINTFSTRFHFSCIFVFIIFTDINTNDIIKLTYRYSPCPISLQIEVMIAFIIFLPDSFLTLLRF